mmetsp:Transcript_45098/g.139553  ORF Transcript_45098/g.139553 Transcript_45098/m.139553 type:complete len:108 (-) Transcript_45098:60-383(-)
MRPCRTLSFMPSASGKMRWICGIHALPGHVSDIASELAVYWELDVGLASCPAGCKSFSRGVVMSSEMTSSCIAARCLTVDAAIAAGKGHTQTGRDPHPQALSGPCTL